jgi:hypothetical protein
MKSRDEYGEKGHFVALGASGKVRRAEILIRSDRHYELCVVLLNRRRVWLTTRRAPQRPRRFRELPTAMGWVKYYLPGIAVVVEPFLTSRKPK